VTCHQIVYIVSTLIGTIRSHAELVSVRALGPLRISCANDATVSLTQPRRSALLSYLLLARPRGLHARDTLVALLWPDADQAHGRHALRNALHAIRHALGDDVVLTAGDEFVGVANERIACDALAFEDDVAAKRYEQALARYEGELLEGFHVTDAPEFERWLDGQRRSLRDLALVAAWAHADELRGRGDATGAMNAARRAHALAPDDELSLCRLLPLLTAAGDRATALRAYREFAEQLRADYGAEPSPETQAIAQKISAVAPPAPRLDVPLVDNLSSADPVRDSAADCAPSHSPRQRLRGRRFLTAAAAAPALLVALSSFVRAGRTVPRVSPDALEQAARQQAVVLGAGLPERFRADTALYQRYLRAEALLQGDRYRPARDSFQAIVNGAPLYAPAWAGLSTAVSLSGFSEMPPADAMPLSLAAAQRALALDSTLVHAKSTLIAYDLEGRWDLAAAKRGLDAALAGHPDDQQLNELLATWHRWRGEWAEAIAIRRKLHRLNPLKPGYAQSVGGNLYFSHQCAEAVDVLQRMVMGYHATPTARNNLYKSYRCLGRMDDAAAQLREQLREQGDTALGRLLDPPMSHARRDSMMRVVIRAQIARSLERRRRAWVPARDVAVKYAELGDADSTLIWIDSMYTERAMSLHTVPFDPIFDFLRDDPRYHTFERTLPWHPRAPAARKQLGLR
jgi:DNA-binding SARP family transcriptional activator